MCESVCLSLVFAPVLFPVLAGDDLNEGAMEMQILETLLDFAGYLPVHKSLLSVIASNLKNQ